MRTFAAAILAATAYADVTADVQKAVSDVTNWLLGKTKENLSTDSQRKEFTFYNSTATLQGLTGCFSLDNTALGVNFITAEFDLSGAAYNWASGSASLVFFQIEQPLEVDTTARLLQATNVTGTGYYEGWSGTLVQPADAAMTLKSNKNHWGKTVLAGDA